MIAPEESELADALDSLNNPNAITVTDLLRATMPGVNGIHDWLADRKNRRAIPHSLNLCGYVPVRNDAAKDGYWKIDGKRQPVYSNAKLSLKERIRAASELTRDR